MNTPKVGEYWMFHGGAVLVDGEGHGRFSVQYVQVSDSEHPPRVSSGGGSCYWNASEFTPITDPYLLAATKVFDARRQAHDHKVKASRAETEESKWLAVMEVLHASRASQGEGDGRG